MNTLFGLYRATVVNNTDLQKRKRLQVQNTQLLGAILPWAEACLPYRSRAIPPVGTTVWLQFEAGNIDYPVWIGVLPS